MQRNASAKALAILIVGGAFFLGACSGKAGAPTPGNAVVHVTAGEWQFKPSMTKAPAGPVTFLVANQGKVEHELVLLKTDKSAKGLAVQPTGKVDEAAAGENVGEVEVEAGVTGASTFNLAAGHYVFICNLPAHYSQGMFGDFTVTGS